MKLKKRAINKVHDLKKVQEFEKNNEVQNCSRNCKNYSLVWKKLVDLKHVHKFEENHGVEQKFLCSKKCLRIWKKSRIWK